MNIAFENQYRSWANRFCLLLLAAHVPVLAGVAAWFGTGISTALIGSALLLAGPAALFFLKPGEQVTSLALGSASMGISALLIHLSHGMIEMHFHIFAAIAFLIVFGNIWPILTAAATIAIHHVVFWIWLPASVFNYKAGLGIVLLHAAFVVFETGPACWIARRLERTLKVQAITAEQLKDAAQQMNSAAAQVSSAGQELSQHAMEQAATLEETSASSNEISAIARQSAEDILTLPSNSCARSTEESGERAK